MVLLNLREEIVLVEENSMHTAKQLFVQNRQSTGGTYYVWGYITKEGCIRKSSYLIVDLTPSNILSVQSGIYEVDLTKML